MTIDTRVLFHKFCEDAQGNLERDELESVDLIYEQKISSYKFT
jgi:hypothetical protein